MKDWIGIMLLSGLTGWHWGGLKGGIILSGLVGFVWFLSLEDETRG